MTLRWTSKAGVQRGGWGRPAERRQPGAPAAKPATSRTRCQTMMQGSRRRRYRFAVTPRRGCRGAIRARWRHLPALARLTARMACRPVAYRRRIGPPIRMCPGVLWLVRPIASRVRGTLAANSTHGVDRPSPPGAFVHAGLNYVGSLSKRSGEIARSGGPEILPRSRSGSANTRQASLSPGSLIGMGGRGPTSQRINDVQGESGPEGCTRPFGYGFER
jgi:hypothetical protein